MKPAAIVPLLALKLLAQNASAPPEAGAIIRQAFSHQGDFFEQARDYTYMRHQEMKRLDARGKVTKTESTVHEITILYGEPYERLVRKDDRVLTEGEARKEQRKMDSELAKRGKNVDKRRREAESKREKSRRALAEVAEAFDWKLEGEETVSGRPAWIVRGTARAGYKPRSREAKIFTKMSGRLWIDRAGSRMVKADVAVDDTISFGLFILRIKPGFRFRFELTRMEGDAWLPLHGWLKGEAKVGGLKTYRIEMDTRYTDYRRFQSESRIVATGAPQE